jgi:hypothetical protein
MNQVKVFLTIMPLFSFFTLSAQEMRFDDPKYNFGFVDQGDTVRMLFKFSNTGSSPLVISDYKVECSCTVMEIPSKPVMPGETSFLHISFDTHNKYDRQDRTVTVISNAKNSPQTVRFKGVVRQPKRKK